MKVRRKQHLAGLIGVTALVMAVCAPQLRAADVPPKPDAATIAKLIRTAQMLDHACDASFDWMIHQQNEDGSYGRNPRTGKPYPSVGLTAMSLRAILSIPHEYAPQDGPFVTKPADWMKSVQKKDGAIVADDEKTANYETAVAILALEKCKSFGVTDYDATIANGVSYLKGCQYQPVAGDPKSGGVGYRSGDTKVDLPNTAFFIQALNAAGYKNDSPEFKNALSFLERCQASPEVNKLAWAKDQTDGGGRYNETGLTQDPKGQSTGAISYVLMSSYMKLDVPDNDPRMVAVLNYVANHYSTEEHPGLGYDGLFYYYVMMSQSLDEHARAANLYRVKTADGTDHDWTVELGRKLLSLQARDGSFVNSKSGKYWESDSVLCTAYAMLAMGQCYHDIEHELDLYHIDIPDDD
ncbi:MAG: prenyltransferase/squalene oxidase repeat-containing protein [Planctomycetota bacterium]